MDKHFVGEVIGASDIVEVISRYVRLTPMGKYHKGLCPFHKEKTPSFTVTPSRQIYKCFGCSKGGNVLQFLMDAENLPFHDALMILAEKAGIPVPDDGDEEAARKERYREELYKANALAARWFYDNLTGRREREIDEYIEGRGVGKGTISRFGIGYSLSSKRGLTDFLAASGLRKEAIAGSGLVGSSGGALSDRFVKRLMFPIIDVRGRVVGFGGRVVDGSMPKYINTPGTEVYQKGRQLYGLNLAKGSLSDGRVIIVEGYMDVVALHQYGVRNAVASLGTALTEQQAKLLSKFARDVVIAYDADSAGRGAALKGYGVLRAAGCEVRIMSLEGSKDPDEYIRANGREAFDRSVAKAMGVAEYRLEALGRETDVTGPAGKVAYIDKAAEILASTENPAEREVYARNASEKVGVSFQSLISEVDRRAARKARREGAREGGPAMGPPTRPKRSGVKPDDEKALRCERTILCLLSIDNGLYDDYEGELGRLEFTGEAEAGLYASVAATLASGGDLTPAELMQMCADGLAERMASLMVEECSEADHRPLFEEKLREMGTLKDGRVRESLLAALKSGDLGDDERRECLSKLNELHKRKGTV